jgi:hypothetical protein
MAHKIIKDAPWKQRTKRQPGDALKMSEYEMIKSLEGVCAKVGTSDTPRKSQNSAHL